MEPLKGYTHDAAFQMPTAKEPPPRDPATPPGKPPMGEDVWSNREGQRAQELRATALGLAVTRLGTAGDPYALADEFLAYLTDGTKPGTTP
jgi:hypothetical protein